MPRPVVGMYINVGPTSENTYIVVKVKGNQAHFPGRSGPSCATHGKSSKPPVYIVSALRYQAYVRHICRRLGISPAVQASHASIYEVGLLVASSEEQSSEHPQCLPANETTLSTLRFA